jgi:hypothetical protein
VRFADLRIQRVLRQRRLDARDEIAAVRVVVGVLELAPTALRKMPARRLLMMRPRRERSVVQKSVVRYAERDVPTA